MLLGVHVGAREGLRAALGQAVSLGANAVQLSTRSATRWFTAPLDPQEVVGFRRAADRLDHSCLLALASPLINLAVPDEAHWKRSLDALYDELMRAEALGLAWVVVPPGWHDGQGEESGLRKALQMLNRVLERTRGFRAGILLETSAGEENALGYNFEQLARLRRRLEDARRVGICVDTAKVFSAGYDLRELPAYLQTLAELQKTVGLKHVKAVHLADSRSPLGSRRGAPAAPGEGELGLEAMSFFVNDPRLAEVPLIIEAPLGRGGDAQSLGLKSIQALEGAVTIAV